MKKSKSQQQSKLITKNKIIYIVLCVVVFIVIDQLTKFILINNNVESGLINLTVEQVEFSNIGLNILTSLIIIALAVNFIYHQIDIIDKITCIGVSMIIAGVISNLADKLIMAKTIHLFKLFGIFDLNIASIILIVGWIIVIYTTMTFSSAKDLKRKRIIEEQDKEFKTGANSKIKE